MNLNVVILLVFMSVLVKYTDDWWTFVRWKSCRGLQTMSALENKTFRKTYSILEAKQPFELVPVSNDIRETPKFERPTEVVERLLLLHPCGPICYTSEDAGRRARVHTGYPLVIRRRVH